MKIFTLVIALLLMGHMSAATNQPATLNNNPAESIHNRLVATLTKIAQTLTHALQKNPKKPPTHKHMPAEIDQGIIYLEDLVRDLSRAEISLENSIQLICGEAQHIIPKGKNLSRNEHSRLLTALIQLNRNLEEIFSEEQIAQHIDRILANNFIDSVCIGCVLENLEKLKDKIKERFNNTDREISLQITQLSERTTAITEVTLQIANNTLRKKGDIKTSPFFLT